MTMNVDRMIAKLEQCLEDMRQMRLEIERLETKAKGLGGSGHEHGSKAPRPDRMENAAIEIDLEKDRQAYRRREIYLFRQQALAIIWSLEDHAQAYVLDLYYVRGMTTRQIAEDIGMSKSWVEEKKQSGLRRLARL